MAKSKTVPKEVWDRRADDLQTILAYQKIVGEPPNYHNSLPCERM